ncbi:MAG: FecR domain-containing protein [Alistipes sp.]|nr:FecR domain-containing protein [Alistipes sp.]
MKDIDEKIIIGYLKGKIPRDEASRIERWMDSDEENRDLVQQISDALMLEGTIESMYRSDPSGPYIDFKRNLDSKARKGEGGRRKSLGRVAVAAVVAATLSLTGLAGIYLAGQEEHTIAVRTNIGERTQMELPDGSLVWLNACTQVRYISSLFSRERRIELSGEAYFEVEKNSKPFVVDCQGMNIKVLGTKFNVMSNPEDEQITTTLVEGAVQVSSPYIKREKGVNMKPQDQLVIDKTTGNSIITNMYDTGLAVGWIDGTLSFDGNTFEQIARTLERNYNIEIVFMDEKVKQSKFICDFSTNDNIYRIMSTLGMTEKFGFRVDGRKIEIESR